MVFRGVILHRNGTAFNETHSNQRPGGKGVSPDENHQDCGRWLSRCIGGLRSTCVFWTPSATRYRRNSALPARSRQSARFLGYVHQGDCSTAWSAVGAVAFSAGLIIAVGAIAHSNRSRGASVFCRPLLFLAAATAMAAATPMFLATGNFSLTFHALLTSDVQLNGEQFRQSLMLGPLYAGFALLVGVSIVLVAASFSRKLPRSRRDRPTA